MRVRQISVKNLFDIFNHSIPLNMEERITIIHGPNGFGKTALLRLIDGLFNSRYLQLRSIPFTEFRIDFDNRSRVRVEKGRTDDDGKVEIHFSEMEKEERSFTPKSPKEAEQLALFKDSIGVANGLLERVGRDEWLYHPTGERLSTDEIIDRFGDALPPELFKSVNEPPWWKSFRKNFFVRLIQTQRLLSLSATGDTAHSRYRWQDRWQALMQPTVEEYSKELASVIRTKLAESAELSQELQQQIEAIRDETHDKWHVCCGHDLIGILSVGLHKAIGSQRYWKEIELEILERSLRLAYESAWFRDTRLYASIRAWEEINGSFQVIPSVPEDTQH